ncbi:MAG: dethiobiotin synthase [Acidimicrobiaceae bacterium]|nr:dethiobiotin synthase [Acidimicrobiaceae bacterium]
MPDPVAAPGAQTRPEVVVFVAGTGTEVGKTWAAAELARVLRDRGCVVAACKPVQSHDPDEAGPTDAAALAAATGQHPDDVCPPEHTYPVPLAPPMAADKLGRICPTVDELATICRFGSTVGIGLVEGVGGLYSPVAPDGHNLDLIERIEPDLVIVVAPAGLGGIHDSMACASPLAAYRHAVFLNRFDPRIEVHSLNLRWLRDAGLAVATSLPELADIVGTDPVGRPRGGD